LIDEYGATATTAARKEQIKTDLRQRVLAHIQDIGSKTNGKVVHWDVLNEPRTNHDLMDILGQQEMVEWFKAARASNPQAKLFINEYDILTSGGTRPANRALYESQIKYLQQQGAPIGGIGMQGHFSDGSLTGPENVWAVLDRFHDNTGLPIQITEFDLTTTDRELQADYVRDFMTAVFAHEGVSDFLQWGFWAGAHWRPDAAMFDEAWNIRPHGEEYMRLVFDEWWTSEDLVTGQLGEAALRGFLGDYEVTVLHDGLQQTYQLVLAPGGGTYELVLVPEPGTVAVIAAAGLLLLRVRRARPALV
jgi:GH35 family endo-1,4-beta-xylanase